MKSCSILIPTHNRPNYLFRLLNFYNHCGEHFNIIIGDSSVKKRKYLNKKAVSSFPNLKIKYHSYPESMNPYSKFADMLFHSNTEYCVFCADDDFILAEGIRKSVNFLGKNPGYVGVHGNYLKFYLFAYGGKQCFFWEPMYSSRSIESNSPQKRLSSQFSSYMPTFYAVLRTKSAKKAYRASFGQKINYLLFGELLLSIMTLMHGKIKSLDVLYGARQGNSASRGNWISPLEEFNKKAAYDKSYRSFQQLLSLHVARNCRMSIEESKRFIDHFMSLYQRRYHKIHSGNRLKLKRFFDALKAPVRMDERIRMLYRKFFTKLRQDIPNAAYYGELKKVRDCALLNVNKNEI